MMRRCVLDIGVRDGRNGLGANIILVVIDRLEALGHRVDCPHLLRLIILLFPSLQLSTGVLNVRSLIVKLSNVFHDVEVGAEIVGTWPWAQILDFANRRAVAS